MSRCLPCEAQRRSVSTAGLGSVGAHGRIPTPILQRHAAEHRAMDRRGIHGQIVYRAGLRNELPRWQRPALGSTGFVSPKGQAIAGTLAVLGLGALALWYVTS